MLLYGVLNIGNRLEIWSRFSLKIFLLLYLLSVHFFSVAKLHDSVCVYEIGNHNNVLCFSSWDTSSIGKEFASLILDVVDMLRKLGRTVAKGE